MARHITVDEAAKILGTTDRTIRRMLNEGRLSGSQTVDKGKTVWRVNLTKELLQKMQHYGTIKDVIDVQPAELDNTDTIEASVYNQNPETTEDRTFHQEENTKSLAGSIWSEIESRFVDRLSAQSEEIGRLKSQLEDSSAKIRLLEDHQRELNQLPRIKEQAEKDREALEAKAFELEAAKKQINAIEAEKEAALKAATEASINKEMLAREIETLKKEKEQETAAVQAQMAALASTLDELKRPWWSKLFGTGDSQKK